MFYRTPMAQDHDEEEIEEEEAEETEPTDDDLEDIDEDKDGDNKDPDFIKDEDIEKDNDVKSLKAKLKKQQEARIKSREAQRQLTARAKKAEGASKKPDASSRTTKNNQERKTGNDLVEKRLSAIEVIESKRQFGHVNDLSPEETDLAFKFANGKPTKKTLSDPFFKAGLEGIRTAKRIAANVPGSSRRSSSLSNKSFAELTKEERKANHQARMDAIRRT